MNTSPGRNSAASVPQQATFLGHPIGLYVLFFTEMWERFSYYGMRALLILYMLNHFKWTQEEASSIYKWYTSLVYLTPLLGGFLADRYLGNKWAIVIGATLMAIGHFCMAFEEIAIFYAALGFLIMGNGFFKPNMSAQVGRLYPANDDRRDAAYTIFYMGINLGAFLSPLACGYLGAQDKINIFGYDVVGYHAGFSLAGIGMVLGLLVYLLGLPLVKELPPEAIAKPRGVEKSSHVMTEEEAVTTPSVIPAISEIGPQLMYAIGGLCILTAGVGYLLHDALPEFLQAIAKTDNLVGLGVGGGVANFMGGWILSQLKMAVRDRVFAIFITALFVIFFWAAFEQAGNAMNVHADKVTNRYMGDAAPPPPLFPVVAAAAESQPQAAAQPESGVGAVLSLLGGAFNLASGDWWYSTKPIVLLAFMVLLIWLYTATELATAPGGVRILVGVPVALLGLVLLAFAPTFAQIYSAFNPVPTAWFQSINALAIFVLAPVFAWLWVWLPRKGINLSIPAKVAIGVFMQGAAFALMIWSVNYENGSTSAALAELPRNMKMEDGGRVVFINAPNLDEDADKHYAGEPAHVRVHGGRLRYDRSAAALQSNGVLSDIDRDQMLRATAPLDFTKAVQELARGTQKAKAGKDGAAFPVEVSIAPLPDGFDPNYIGFAPNDVRFDAERSVLVANVELADKDYKQILLCGAAPRFRDALNRIYVDSAVFKLGVWWLFWFYILCTLGELCLSPVGLSMVSKLAPARFVTMLMGMWLLTSFFGNFLAGFAGENWSQYHPYQYFGVIAAVLVVASFICFLLVRKMTAMMHGVR